jgi:STE24 endopeptidase
MAEQFTVLFLAALAATTLTRLWLASRHIRHVERHRNAVPAAFGVTIPLPAHQKAADYTVAKTRLGRLEVVLGAGFLLLLTAGGLLQGFFDFWTRWFEAGSHAHGIAFIGSVVLASFLVDLPFSLWRTFVVEARFGFNKMTLRLFLADLAKEGAIAAAVGIPVLFAVLWLMDHMGALWWFWVWAFWLAFNLLVLLIYPTFIAPLFNKFSPLADATLRSRIEALLTRCGFRSSGLFVMDGSRRSSHGNAYFTGFGAAKRIVFFDTLLEKLQPDEIEAVLAHELGHYRHHHIWKRIAVLAAGSLGFFWLLGWIIDEAWFYQGLGMTSAGTAAALVLFSLVLPVFTFPLAPLMSRWSRRHEFEADAYAAQHARAADLIAALVKLYRDNASTLTPDPLYSQFYDSHPPAALRIARLQSA